MVRTPLQIAARVHSGFPEQYRDILGCTRLSTLDRLVEAALANLQANPSSRKDEHGLAELEVLRADLVRLREM